MNKLKLFMAAAAAVSLSAAMAVPAMAEDIAFKYDKKTGQVTMSGVESSGNKQTLVVLTEDADKLTKETVVQIGQEDGVIEGFKLPDETELDKATYYIRIGGSDGTIQRAVLKIDNTTKPVIFSDSDQNGTLNMIDSSMLSRAIVKSKKNKGLAGRTLTVDGTPMVFGDADKNGALNMIDSSMLSRAIVKSSKNKGLAGTEVQIPVSELQAAE